jgi:hypothetical protein
LKGGKKTRMRGVDKRKHKGWKEATVRAEAAYKKTLGRKQNTSARKARK